MDLWTLIADADAIELLIRIGIVVVFMLGPYLLQLLGGKAVQDDRGNAGKRRQREPQSELEKEIAEFLEQSRRGGSSQSPQQRSDYAEAKIEEDEDFIPADVAPERPSERRDRERRSSEQPALVQPATDTQTGKAMANSLEAQPYLDDSQLGDLGTESYQYEEAETFSYDPVAAKPADPGAAPNVAAMLRDPAHVRNAFVLSEIMARPDFRRR